ncbi:MAG: homoserine O-acetyltransferase, partial [Actinobacteria bacterium]|nr:homoserine O-acetyltransferase [Actinomycetota bacterium]
TPTALPVKTISSPFGHDGFLIEVESVGAIIRETIEIGRKTRATVAVPS